MTRRDSEGIKPRRPLLSSGREFSGPRSSPHKIHNSNSATLLFSTSLPYFLSCLPGQDEDDVVGGEPDEDAVGRALHLRPAQDEDGDEVAHEAERAHAVQQDARQEELEDKVQVGGARQVQAAAAPAAAPGDVTAARAICPDVLRCSRDTLGGDGGHVGRRARAAAALSDSVPRRQSPGELYARLLEMMRGNKCRLDYDIRTQKPPVHE